MRMLGLIVGVLLLVAGCGASGGSAPAPTTAAATPDRIVIKNFMFSPMSITVAPGAKISVTNQDTATHTLTATGKAFDSGDIAPGKTVTVTAPAKPGTYDYLCDIHQYMSGVIKVSQTRKLTGSLLPTSARP